MKGSTLDNIDKKIIRILADDARASVKDIAQAVYLTPPAVSNRIDQLVKKGYLSGFHAVPDPEKLGYPVRAFINLLVPPKDTQKVYPYLESCPNVTGCYSVTGDFSVLLEVRFRDTAELEGFVGKLQGFGRTKTVIVLSALVDHREILPPEE